MESCNGVGFKDGGKVGSRAARVAKCVCGFEMTGISRTGANIWCSDCRISLILKGTTTTRLLGSVLALDRGVEVGGGSPDGPATGI